MLNVNVLSEKEEEEDKRKKENVTS